MQVMELQDRLRVYQAQEHVRRDRARTTPQGTPKIAGCRADARASTHDEEQVQGGDIEGARSVAVITDHATLRRLPTANGAEKLAKTPRRYIPWLSVISPYLAIHPNTQQPILNIIYRKGKDNEADALSRRPNLAQQLDEYEHTTFENELLELHEHLTSMIHLLFDETILNKIRTTTTLDPNLNKASLPPGATYSTIDNLYHFGDKLYIPTDPQLMSDIIYEFHDTNGHPNPTRTLTNVSQVFYFPRMSKVIKRYCKNASHANA